MHAALFSAGMVALAEFGDKTQLLALLLATRFRRPVPIILGMLTATLLNHAAAGLVGGLAVAAIDPSLLRWTLGAAFLAMAAWTLVPDTLDETRAARGAVGSAYLATVVSFFLAEMGDKTQIATAALAARFGSVLPVIVGTTIGMMAVDIPTVLFGHLAGHRLDPRWARFVAAVAFALFGALALAGVEAF
jgi:putative Ca2+/H+ antiporter (TMEM165/GDT1 family)